MVGQRGEVAEEAVAARDLERHQRDLPRPTRRFQRPVQTPDVHDEDARPRPVRRRGRPGSEFTIPPSMKCSFTDPGMGGRMPGTAEEASTASTIGPAVNQRSAALSMLAATHWKRTGRSSISGIVSASVIWARNALVAVQVRAGARERRQAPEQRAGEDVGSARCPTRSPPGA